jgi:prepilin-type processing-associated H-X9-DG protein
MPCLRQGPRNSLTLIELLVVVAVIALLLGLLLPAVQRVRQAAARASCLANLKQIGLALANYHGDHGRLPPSAGQIRIGRQGRIATLGWMVLLLPYLEQESLLAATLRAWRVEPLSYRNPPHVGLATVLPPYACPADGRLRSPLGDQNGITAAYTSYIGVAGMGKRDGVIGSRPGVRLAEITDGTSNTLAVAERPPPGTLQAGWWYSLDVLSVADALTRGPNASLVAAYPAGVRMGGICSSPFHFGPGRIDNPCDRYHFWSLHPGGANFLFADGSVRFLSYAAEPLIPALATRDGGEVVNLSE